MPPSRRNPRKSRPIDPAATARTSRAQKLLLGAGIGVLAAAAAVLWVQSCATRDTGGQLEGWYNGVPFPQKGLPVEQIRIGDVPLVVEVASEWHQIMIGLMGRRSVPDGTGMLFLLDEPPEHFWMRNCPIDLDLAFFDKDRKLVTVLTMKAFDEDPDGKYKPSAPSLLAVETRGGYLREKGVKVGDELHLPESLLKQLPKNDD